MKDLTKNQLLLLIVLSVLFAAIQFALDRNLDPTERFNSALLKGILFGLLFGWNLGSLPQKPERVNREDHSVLRMQYRIVALITGFGLLLSLLLFAVINYENLTQLF